MKNNIVQDLSKFIMPKNFRGKSSMYVQIWWIVQSSIFRGSPQFAYSYRAWLLRIFGAKIGSNVIIRPSVKITYPWKVTIGDNSWIGDDVILYSLGEITIGENTVISQKSYLCAGDHDYKDVNFTIRARSINIGDECWIATDTYVAPGVTVGNKVIVGARSSVFKDLQDNQICFGSPCKPIKTRFKQE